MRIHDMDEATFNALIAECDIIPKMPSIVAATTLDEKKSALVRILHESFAIRAAFNNGLKDEDFKDIWPTMTVARYRELLGNPTTIKSVVGARCNLEKGQGYRVSPGEPDDNEPEPDWTVYDLAERQAAGLEQSNAAGLEVYQELCRIKGMLATLDTTIYPMGKQRENARALLDIRDRLEAIAKGMRP